MNNSINKPPETAALQSTTVYVYIIDDEELLRLLTYV